jgi:hypothetical protein
MPVMVRTLSVSQFCDLLAIDPAYFNSVALVWSHIGFNEQGNKTYRREIAIYMEPHGGLDSGVLGLAEAGGGAATRDVHSQMREEPDSHADTRDESAALSGQRHEEKAQGR